MPEESNIIMLPGPTNVPSRVMRAMLRPIIGHRGEDFHSLFASIQEKSKKVFMTSNDVLVFSASGTGAVEAAINNFNAKGEKMVVPVFGDFGKRVADTTEKLGIKAIRPELELGKAPTTDLVRSMLEDHPDARAVFIIYNETSTGVTVRELQGISQEARRLGALTIVDAVSILGGDHLYVDDWGIDVCLTGSQKCLGVPPGLSMISVNERALEVARKIDVETTYFSVPRNMYYLRERKETPFTPAIPLFFALDEALNVVLEEGLERRIERHRVCASAFYAAFQEMGLRFLAKEECRSYTVIAVRYPEDIDDGKFKKLLKDRYGVWIAGGMPPLKGKIFRLGSMGEVSPQKVLRTIQGISETLNYMGFANDGASARSVALEHLEKLSPKRNT